jgi:hypothetical protein
MDVIPQPGDAPPDGIFDWHVPCNVLSIMTLADRINTAAADPTTARFHKKAFISGVWDALWDIDITLEDFKAECVELNRLGLIHLCRADLVQVMDPKEVKRSEITYLNDTTFNFIKAL